MRRRCRAGSLSWGCLQATAAELARAKLSIFRPQSYTAHDDGGSWSGRANVAYQFTGDLMGYVSYAHGYKSGGLNMSGLPLDAQNQPTLATAVIKDEQNATTELGFKSTLRDGKATLNLAAYHTVVQDYQSNIVSSLETAAIRSYPANIPEVRVQGLEADFATLRHRGLHGALLARLCGRREHGLSRRTVPARGADGRDRGLQPHRCAAARPVQVVRIARPWTTAGKRGAET